MTTVVRPEGLTYRSEFLARDDERALLAEIEALPFEEVRMHGVVARRKTIHFGWDYDYEGWSIAPAAPPPAFLEPLLERCAAAAGLPRSALAQVMVARYPPGAAIGWHRDAPMFGSPIIGVSLGSPCVLRFRRGQVRNWETYAQLLEPRSLYLLDGPARTQWQHGIRETKELRYSVTARTVRREG